jgi:ring-1,2-phenylacetyl-CoA epoxidase subunit PaaD
MVSAAFAIAATVCDPEVPVLTIADLGILRTVEMEGETPVVTITPTYSGCPAMGVIALDLELAFLKAGFPKPRIETSLSPAWTTDWMTNEGHEKLKAYGIAPPVNATSKRGLFSSEIVECPLCDSKNTAKISEFGSTSCKALWRCNACREPFDYFKCI